MSSTSGFARSSHHQTFSSRARRELTFQVAIRMPRSAPRELHERGETLHPLEALLDPITAEVDDQLAHAEPRIRLHVLQNLLRRAAERAPPARVDHRGVVHGRLEGDGEP